jgi:hypothetical protein
VEPGIPPIPVTSPHTYALRKIRSLSPLPGRSKQTGGPCNRVYSPDQLVSLSLLDPLSLPLSISGSMSVLVCNAHSRPVSPVFASRCPHRLRFFHHALSLCCSARVELCRVLVFSVCKHCLLVFVLSFSVFSLVCWHRCCDRNDNEIIPVQ